MRSNGNNHSGRLDRLEARLDTLAPVDHPEDPAPINEYVFCEALAAVLRGDYGTAVTFDPAVGWVALAYNAGDLAHLLNTLAAREPGAVFWPLDGNQWTEGRKMLDAGRWRVQLASLPSTIGILPSDPADRSAAEHGYLVASACNVALLQMPDWPPPRDVDGLRRLLNEHYSLMDLLFSGRGVDRPPLASYEEINGLPAK